MNPKNSLLFFPATRPELLSKAVASGAGWVCVDLEDAVAADAKDSARAAVLDLLSAPDRPDQLVVRINHPATAHGRRDVEALEQLEESPDQLTLMVPKTDAPDDLELVKGAFAPDIGEVPLIPLIETVRGLANVESIAAAEGVVALQFGGLDLSAELGCALDWEALLYARSRCVHAARLAGVGLIDTPFFDVGDPEGLRLDAERARRLGFTAKASIHPSQIETIHTAFAPSEEEVADARSVLQALNREGRGVFLLDGVMVDRPVVDEAARIVSWSDSDEE